jgi:hypothetical protein
MQQKDLVSPDGNWRWDGTQWVPNQSPVQYPSPPPPGSTAAPRVPPMPAVPAWRPPPTTQSLAYHFKGDALWSILFGVLSVFVPLVSRFYFPILPIFGLWRGVLAVRRGRMAGGVIGLVVSALGCLISLLASGLLDSLVR